MRGELTPLPSAFPSLLFSEVHHLDGPEWLPENTRVSPMMYLEKQLMKARVNTDIADRGEGAGQPALPTDVEIDAANTLANRIRWMLQETMVRSQREGPAGGGGSTGAWGGVP